MFTQKKNLIIPVLAILALFGALAANAGSGRAAPPSSPAVPAVETGTAFTYQGQLTENGSPANGPYDFSFLLYDALTGGAQVGASIVVPDVTVGEGLFTVEIDFGEAFEGQARWLEIAVRPGDSSNDYTTLSPRQPLTAAPYALSLRPGATIAGDVTSGEGVLNLSSNGGYGLDVESATSSGVRVQSAGGSGVSIISADNYGLYVGTSGYTGVAVGTAGSYGVYVGSATLDGVYVGHADDYGVHIDSTSLSAIRVESAGNNGVYVISAGGDGLLVCSTGSGTCGSTDADNNNGVEVAQAEDYGARVLAAGRAGFRIDDPGTNGFYVTDAGDSGIWVTAATNYAGFFNGDINVTGNCTGCLLATFALNTSNAPLRPGDIVTVIGVEQSRAANADMVLQVHPAAAGQPLVGVVSGRAEWHTSAEDGATVLVPREGKTAVPGDYLTIITHGPEQVLAADNHTITPGTKLTLTGDGRVRPLQTIVVDGVSLAESAPVIGLALSTPDTNGWVWILVNPQ